VIRKTELGTNLSKNNVHNVHHYKTKIIVSQGFHFKAHEPENIVDHMHHVLVQDIHLHEQGSIFGDAEKTTVKRER
jgi:hypothetical protein